VLWVGAVTRTHSSGLLCNSSCKMIATVCVLPVPGGP
jgi:hypothetical protein